MRRAASRPLPADVLFAERLLAVLSGQRPVHSMLRHTAGRAYDELSRLAERGPLRTRGTHPVLRAIGYFEPRPGAVEVFARIGAGDQLRAMAFRLERGRDLRWRCTAVELGGAVRAPRGEGGEDSPKGRAPSGVPALRRPSCRRRYRAAGDRVVTSCGAGRPWPACGAPRG
ncbi:hypothetical protein SFUMM280S_10407 [Streptomyces fumanus]